MDEELERFKTEIKLHEYAASIGYELDQRDTSKRETIMRCGSDKISIRKDPSDHGSIMDFVISRRGKNFGEARKLLRVWTSYDQAVFFQHLDSAPRGDRNAVVTEYKAMRELRWHDYLEQERRLPRSVLLSPRFRGRIRVDARANVIFPHEDEDGLCGFEKRNRKFKGFADMGEKGLWMSNTFPADGRLVVGESAIDCISYEILFPGGRYASIAGGLSPKQPGLILLSCKAMPADSEVVSITHADADGERYAGSSGFIAR
jgi:hypothetical protein